MGKTNDLHSWHEGLRQPMGGNPLHEPVMAAIHGYRFNDEFWRLNDQGFQSLCWSPSWADGNSSRSRGLNLAASAHYTIR